jgi:serine/threonine protein kinase
MPINPTGSSAPKLPLPIIHDYKVLRFIGQGNYGQVWLACDVTGEYRAVKTIYRASFDNSKPFDREFAAIKKYARISRRHPGLLNILHVGINKEGGYFYYVMDLADDRVHGQEEVDTATYEAKTLQRGQRLPVAECIDIGVTLTDALNFLHRKRLIHRDIKLSNTIFVNGQAQFADVGLVTTIGESQTYVGTEGYIPPEGPSSPQADLYALGKVLYEISTGKDRLDFPGLHTDISDEKDRDQFLALNAIILKACDPDIKKRYQTAQEMHDALVAAREDRKNAQERQAALIAAREKNDRRRRARIRTILLCSCMVLLLWGIFYKVPCNSCAATGKLLTSIKSQQAVSCDPCEGTGYVPGWFWGGYWPSKCRKCYGTGRVSGIVINNNTDLCAKCKATGKVYWWHNYK